MDNFLFLINDIPAGKSNYVMAKPNAAVKASTPRSPSPEPIYSGDGKRLNTREYRKR